VTYAAESRPTAPDDRVPPLTDLVPRPPTAAPRRVTVSADTPPAVRTVAIVRTPPTPADELRVEVRTHATLPAGLESLAAFALADRPGPLSAHPAWLTVLRRALGHDVYALDAVSHGRTVGYLPLAHVRSLLFGQYLVSLPYLNSNGVVAKSAGVRARLIDRAVELADELGVKHLELRHETPTAHPALGHTNASKVHMRLALPGTAEALWKGFDAKVRNQIRKAEKSNFTMAWGGVELLEPFYAVLGRNMRDLGTPVYGRSLFATILTTFPGDAELGVLSTPEGMPVAAALLLHGPGVTEVPTASSLREFNATCANMLLYRHLLDRAVARGQRVFDFGRSTTDGPTFKFKKQWGAVPHPAAWQYYSRTGGVSDARPDNPKYRKAIELWQKMPVWLTDAIGPAIVRGIP
jgi:FemAB-related protein (PEP-CTERM system-associated)